METTRDKENYPRILIDVHVFSRGNEIYEAFFSNSSYFEDAAICKEAIESVREINSSKEYDKYYKDILDWYNNLNHYANFIKVECGRNISKNIVNEAIKGHYEEYVPFLSYIARHFCKCRLKAFIVLGGRYVDTDSLRRLIVGGGLCGGRVALDRDHTRIICDDIWLFVKG